MWDFTHPRVTAPFPFSSSLSLIVLIRLGSSQVLAFPILPAFLTVEIAVLESANSRILSLLSKFLTAPAIPAISPSQTVAITPTWEFLCGEQPIQPFLYYPPPTFPSSSMLPSEYTSFLPSVTSSSYSLVSHHLLSSNSSNSSPTSRISILGHLSPHDSSSFSSKPN